MSITDLVSRRSTCLRRSVGALLVKDKRILATGYNGPPAGLPHCDELGGCLRDRLKVPSGERHEISRAIHAEQNAIIQAATSGVNIQGATHYSTHHPCILCTKMVINAGIKRIVVRDGYPDKLSGQMLEEARLKVETFKPRER
jgi:dCMP deaminase